MGGSIDVRRTDVRRTDVFLLDCKKSFGVLKYILIFAEPKGTTDMRTPSTGRISESGIIPNEAVCVEADGLYFFQI